MNITREQFFVMFIFLDKVFNTVIYFNHHLRFYLITNVTYTIGESSFKIIVYLL